MKIWPETYKIWKYFEKGHLIACDSCMQLTDRIGPELVIDVIEFTLVLLMKAAKFIICIYILYRLSSVKLILSESFGKLQSTRTLSVNGNYLPGYNCQHYGYLY